ncbi:NudC domain-containing protein 2 [Bulinus truncatus]|nr:NudC domain-containing protein 2 [Bulinus truncatus]
MPHRKNYQFIISLYCSRYTLVDFTIEEQLFCKINRKETSKYVVCYIIIYLRTENSLDFMAHFDEKSGAVQCKTEWGCWWQTTDEVFIEIHSQNVLNAKDIKCSIKPRRLSVQIKNNILLEGNLYEPVHADDAVWTLEDKCLIRICLSKAHNTAAHCWPSLLVGKYEADLFTFDEMQKKLTLQRFQYENPGMDFSNATMTGNYHGGGPELPS